jgi:hypothetical protein
VDQIGKNGQVAVWRFELKVDIFVFEYGWLKNPRHSFDEGLVLRFAPV